MSSCATLRHQDDSGSSSSSGAFFQALCVFLSMPLVLFTPSPFSPVERVPDPPRIVCPHSPGHCRHQKALTQKDLSTGWIMGKLGTGVWLAGEGQVSGIGGKVGGNWWMAVEWQWEKIHIKSGAWGRKIIGTEGSQSVDCDHKSIIF